MSTGEWIAVVTIAVSILLAVLGFVWRQSRLGSVPDKLADVPVQLAAIRTELVALRAELREWTGDKIRDEIRNHKASCPARRKIEQEITGVHAIMDEP